MNLTLSGATNGLVVGSQSAATLWILDRQQSFQFSTATTSVVEGRTLTITVTRSGVPAGTVTVDYRVGAGGTGTAADFTLWPGPGTLTFPPGVTTRTISVQAVQNTTAGSRSVVLELLNASSGASLRLPSTTTVGLIDNDRPDLVVSVRPGDLAVRPGDREVGIHARTVAGREIVDSEYVVVTDD